ncbi:MAG: hypothetical protein U0U66_08565 [Cytophagaceae bacterium]
MKKHFFITFLLIIICSCNNATEKPITQESTIDSKKINTPSEIKKTTYKEFYLKIADSIVNQHSNKEIWNLSNIDTIEFYTIEDFFINKKTKNRIVLMGGSTGFSSGTADNILMLFSYPDTLKVLWAGQLGDFETKDIIDVNKDGIKEIVCTASSMHMGECHETYTIFNLKNGKKNYLFTSRSFSVIDCGFDNIYETHKKGDTLEIENNCLLNSNPSGYYVQKIQTTKIFYGGNSVDELKSKLKITVDSSDIKL